MFHIKLVLLFCFLLCTLTKVMAFDHVVVIILENADYSQVKKDGSFTALAKTGILYSNFHAITHPSQPNYYAIISGDTFFEDNELHNINSPTIIDQFEAKNITWKAYMEDMPSTCFKGESYDLYDRKHNPFISFTTISGNSKRCANIVPAEEFGTTELPNFSFYTPNENNNGHDTDVSTAGRWLENFMQKHNDILSKENVVVIVTYDESESDENDNHIYTLVLGGVGNSNAGSVVNTRYTLYSITQTIQTNWNLLSMNKNDKKAAPMSFGEISTATSPTTTSTSTSSPSKPTSKCSCR